MWALQDDRGLPVPTPVSLSLPCPLPPSVGTSSLTPARWPLAHRFLGFHVWPSPAAPLTKGPGLHCHLVKDRYPSLVAQTLPI